MILYWNGVIGYQVCRIHDLNQSAVGYVSSEGEHNEQENNASNLK
jgi:hypothetical protein